MGSNNQPRLREATMVITVQIIKLTNEPTFSRIISKHDWTYHWMWYDVFCGIYRWKDKKKCNGNGKNEFWINGSFVICSVKYPAVSWMDSDHDL